MEDFMDSKSQWKGSDPEEEGNNLCSGRVEGVGVKDTAWGISSEKEKKRNRLKTEEKKDGNERIYRCIEK